MRVKSVNGSDKIDEIEKSNQIDMLKTKLN